ncbi:tetratricopeptide repeat protein [Helicobacter winghamensis]|uniref:Tetratricopeptide repeat protein n=1 Tax=Helicobacter winghamensis TaxID=157268 RepID=A0A2N3PI16_9HELI|nr:tetratricopeptide repeat protein [Helicobacter winghamensis]EEO26134.1 tetratricopeptide repeat protein [Helicobacter winghamensis ATCC BAA-430]PKT75727.1 hypothetical protein BCM32_03930 [Helicobacter winghamensis]PKT75936.1 hypothetical protein BCM35_04010 [Helicobacter winghamensis]PKT76173.1 hypothetical protein BCM34_05590 [Helicobacter winghamensis]PKT80319.1 hypothetical protein BCM31_02960 [Helicobacter winghamensis]
MWLKNKSFILLSAVFLFIGIVGCFKQDFITFENHNYKEVENLEDIFIAQGYAALDLGDYESAKDAFNNAYKVNPSPSYLKEILGILVAQNNLQEAQKQAYAFLKQYPKDEMVRSVLIGILTNTKQFDLALKEAKLLLAQHKNAESYELISSVYFLHQDYKNAAKYLRLAYNLNPNPILLDKLAATYLLFLKDSKTAISLYETHIKTQEITKPIGDKLAAIYLESKRYFDAARIYTMLFEETNLQDYARFVLEIYAKSKRLDLAESFLLKHPSVDGRDAILFEIYRLQKDNPKSIKQAEIIYQNTQDINFLAYKAMLSYENSKTRSKTSLQALEKDLKQAALKTNEPLYLNYLGYLMIDHDFNSKKRIEEGIEYVQKALEKDPNNAYYLDSLAWGYFKLKDCENAKITIEKIPKSQIQKEEEIKTHYEKILQCKEN